MFSMVLMAALTTGTDMPDFGRHGRGGCCGGGYGGCYGGGYGGCYGGGYGGCYGGGSRMGYGGCYGGGSRMGYGGGCGGGYGMGYGGGYGGMVWGGASPAIGGAYASSPMISTPILSNLGYGNGAILNPGTTQSFYPNGGAANSANEATIIVHVPADAALTVDGQTTQSRSSTRTFQSPPLEPGKTYTYTLSAEINREGRFLTANKTIEIRAGRPTEVTLNFDNANPPAARSTSPAVPANEGGGDQITPVRPRRTPPLDSTPSPRSFPTPPRER